MALIMGIDLIWCGVLLVKLRRWLLDCLVCLLVVVTLISVVIIVLNFLLLECLVVLLNWIFFQVHELAHDGLVIDCLSLVL